jgi:hypothetical protein
MLNAANWTARLNELATEASATGAGPPPVGQERPAVTRGWSRQAGMVAM